MVYVLLGYLLTALQIAIIARALFSWIDPVGRTPVGAILFRVTDPILMPIRRVMPSTGFVDLSPIIALLLIQVIRVVVGV
jgi:YggT family protein